MRSWARCSDATRVSTPPVNRWRNASLNRDEREGTERVQRLTTPWSSDYGVLLGGAITGGLFISAVLMLYYAVRELIGVGEDATASTLVITPDEPD